MTRADDLRSVRAKIDTPEKWWKGDYTPDGMRGVGQQCPHCLIAALDATIENRAFDYLKAQDAIKWQIPCIGIDLSEWNDAPTTTHADVMRVLDAAIAEAEK